MTAHAISVLSTLEAQARRDALVDLLVDSVEGGSSVNFVWPMTRRKAETWWDGALASHARGERVIFIAEAEGRVDGTAQLILAPQENQAFRAELSKMLVHRRARRQGLGAALMRAVEVEARRIGRTLLTLDTETGSDGERLYTRLGWTKFGEVPAYATRVDGNAREAVSFFYRMLQPLVRCPGASASAALAVRSAAKTSSSYHCKHVKVAVTRPREFRMNSSRRCPARRLKGRTAHH